MTKCDFVLQELSLLISVVTLNHEKNSLKSDFKDIFFKLATNE